MRPSVSGRDKTRVRLVARGWSDQNGRSISAPAQSISLTYADGSSWQQDLQRHRWSYIYPAHDSCVNQCSAIRRIEGGDLVEGVEKQLTLTAAAFNWVKLTQQLASVWMSWHDGALRMVGFPMIPRPFLGPAWLKRNYSWIDLIKSFPFSILPRSYSPIRTSYEHRLHLAR